MTFLNLDQRFYTLLGTFKQKNVYLLGILTTIQIIIDVKPLLTRILYSISFLYKLQTIEAAVPQWFMEPESRVWSK